MIIFFDLDGTILDIRKRYYQAYHDTLQQIKIKPLSQKKYWKLKRSGLREAEILKTASAIDKMTIEKYYTIRNKHIEDPKYLYLDTILDDAMNVITDLSKKNTCVLITSRINSKTLHDQLQNLDLKKFFSDVLYSKTPEGDWKEKKRMILSLNLKNDVGLIVGDTSSEILAGKSLGFYTCGVLNGLRNRKVLEKLKPDFIIKGLQEIYYVIHKISESKNGH